MGWGEGRGRRERVYVAPGGRYGKGRGGGEEEKGKYRGEERKSSEGMGWKVNGYEGERGGGGGEAMEVK